MWLYGNYAVTDGMLGKVFIFHVIVAIVVVVVVVIHIRVLHNTSSNAVAGRGNMLAIRLLAHVIPKDGVLAFAWIAVYAIAIIGYRLFLHSDNNILVGATPVRIQHIVPEWYLLTVYRAIKV